MLRYFLAVALFATMSIGAQRYELYHESPSLSETQIYWCKTVKSFNKRINLVIKTNTYVLCVRDKVRRNGLVRDCESFKQLKELFIKILLRIPDGSSETVELYIKGVRRKDLERKYGL